MLLLHGQPTWSYLYRKVVARLVAHGLRAVAPDLIGFGRSDKPLARTAHSVRAHVDWMAQFADALGLAGVTLVVQDWGGPIGLGVLAARPGLVRRVVAANTALHTADAGLAGRLAWACHAGADGTVTVEQTLLDYQRLTQELTPFRPSLFVQGATASDVPDASWRPTTRRSPTSPSAPGPRQLPLLMGLTPVERVRPPQPAHVRRAGRLRRPLPHRVLRRRPRHRRLGRGAAAARARRGRARRHVTLAGAGTSSRRTGAPSWPTSWPDLVGRHPVALTTRPASTPRQWRPGRRQRVGLGRGPGAELRLEGGQLVVDLRVLADLVELLLDVVGAAADVLEDAGLEQLVEGARPGLHGGDLVLGPLQRRPRVVEGLRDPGRALVDRRDRLGRGVLGLERLLLGAEVVDPLLQRVERLW